MGRLLYIVRDIWQLRRGPQDLPYSPRLLIAVCATSIALSLAIARIADIERDVVGAAIVALGFTLGALYFFLSLRGLRNRFVQSASALVCCAIVFRLLMLPIRLGIGTAPVTPEQITSQQAWLSIAAWVIVIWKFVVDTHVVRQSLTLSFAAGAVVTLLWWYSLVLLAGLAAGL